MASTFLGSLLHQATVTLTNAQIKALPTTGTYPVVLAAEASILHIPISIAYQVDTTAGAYTGVDADAYIVLVYGDWDVEIGSYLTADAFLEATAGFRLGVANFGGIAAATFLAVEALTAVQADVAEAGLDVKIVASNGADFTGGNVANTITITLAYLSLNTTTGAFV